jgi:hypothetical protein
MRQIIPDSHLCSSKNGTEPSVVVSNSDMHIRMAVLILSAGIAQAQSGVPTFRVDRVQPSGGNRPVRLVPGMLVSIYGTDLGPREGCIGQADTKKKETPSPLRPDQAFVETLTYPKELCGVQVMFGEMPSGLLYVQAGQINFKVPQEAAMEGTAPLSVVDQGRSRAAVEMRLGLDWPRSRSNNRRMPADRSGFTSRRRLSRGTAMCNIQWEFTRPISAVMRCWCGATARSFREFPCGRPLPSALG